MANVCSLNPNIENTTSDTTTTLHELLVRICHDVVT